MGHFLNWGDFSERAAIPRGCSSSMGDSSKHNALLEEGAFPSGVLFLRRGLFERGVLLERGTFPSGVLFLNGGPFRVGTYFCEGRSLKQAVLLNVYLCRGALWRGRVS